MTHTKRLFFSVLLLSAVFLGSCDPTPSFPISQIQAQAYGFPLFYDDFEDNDINHDERWFTGSYVVEYRMKQIVDSGQGNKHLILDGPLPEFASQEHGTGFYSNVYDSTNPFQPTYIGFDVFSWVALGENGAFFVLQSRKLPEDPYHNRNLIRFSYRQDGNFNVNGVSYGPFDDQWHRIEFKNITWDSSIPKFNFYIDGNLMAECIEFQEPLFEFEKVAVYNLDEVITGFDNIIMSNPPPTVADISCADEPVPPPPPPPEAGDPSAFIATAKGDAACRQGPANEYPEVDYVTEGFAAPVLGRNQENTWFVLVGPNWGEECWVWKGLLATTGDINPVPVLPDPPLILPDSDGGSGDGPEEGPSACLVQQMNGMTKCVSPCPPNAHPGTTCTP